MYLASAWYLPSCEWSCIILVHVSFSVLQVVSSMETLMKLQKSMFLYVYFSEEEADAELHGRRRSLSSPDRTFRRARRAIRLLIIVVAFAFAVMLISAVILNRFPWYSQEWANVLGIAVACFACVQWVPQVWTTIHLGHLGSLSLASICMGAPVSFFPSSRFEKDLVG
jgi:hypothetical protein